MSHDVPKNVAAPVKQRLLNRARERKEDFNLLLTKYGLERILYRIGQSEYKDAFVLKESYGWYDFPVSAEGNTAHFVGRVEAGRPSVSDPLMGGIV